VIQQLIDGSPEFQLKFVVASESDLAEIDALLTRLKSWSPADVLLMPEGTDAATLRSRAGWIADVCKRTGVYPQQFGTDRRMTLGQGQSSYWNGPAYVTGPFMIVANRIDRSNYPGGPSMCSRLEIGALETSSACRPPNPRGTASARPS